MRKQKPEPIQVVIHMPTVSIQDRRMQLWADVAAQTAGSANCAREASLARFADAALAEFDKRFNQP